MKALGTALLIAGLLVVGLLLIAEGGGLRVLIGLWLWAAAVTLTVFGMALGVRAVWRRWVRP